MPENPDTPNGSELGSETTKYLSDLASESFKRQSELDESIWRSLPFFAATFAFVAAVIGRSSGDVPAWEWSAYASLANAFLILATLSMAWSLRWFWTVLRPRTYQYPAADAEIHQYANELTQFHDSAGLSESSLDAAVTKDLRLFMADQYGSGAAINMDHNQVKLEARSNVLLFMLLGFVLAFGCEATIFIHDRAYGHPQSERVSKHAGAVTNTAKSAAQAKPGARSTDTSQGEAGDRRRQFLGVGSQGKKHVQE